MPYVPGVDNDVFISYARIDDAAAPGEQGWVSRFVADLGRILASTVGIGTNENLKIFFDQRDLKANQYLDELRQNVRRSAAFIAIVSPSYVKRDWTKQELAAFQESGHIDGRIFAIDNMPLEHPDTYPAPFASLARKKFWVQDEHSDTKWPMFFDDRGWKPKIHDVAKQLRDLLAALRVAGGVSAAIENHVPLVAMMEQDRKRTVLLAQVTEDLDDEREQVRRYLEQYRINFLPRGTYPQGGREFIDAVNADLANANCFIQILGAKGSRCPPDLPAGYVRTQYDAARAEAARRTELKMLLWRRPDLDLGQVTHVDKDLLSAPELVNMGLVAVQEEIRRLVEQQKAAIQGPITPSNQDDIQFFINADWEDLPIARAVQADLKRNGCSAFLPVFEGDAKELRTKLEERVVWCDALALIYGAAKPGWINDQAMVYSKLKHRREQPARALVICRAPPLPKEEHGVSMPGLREIDYGTETADDPISKLVSELR
jgi:hypothetical protein